MKFYNWYVMVFSASWLMTAGIYKYSIKKVLLLDKPNERSAHVIPTPRGGGLAFVLSFLTAIAWAKYHNFIPGYFAKALLTASLIAVVGFIDDYRGLPALLRLSLHLIISALCLYVLGGPPSITIFNYSLSSGIVSLIITILYLGWMLNLYNFMDGIDGLASVQAISVCLSISFLYYWTHNSSATIPLVLLSAAVAGFLLWNFPPAKIFMGDVGSGFLGLVIGIFSLQSIHDAPVFFWCWLIMMAVFITDTSLTLLIRVLHKKNPTAAHDTHAYQHATRFTKSHKKVVAAVLFYNLVVLLPISYLVVVTKISIIGGLFMAYSPLVFLAFWFKAGTDKMEVS